MQDSPKGDAEVIKRNNKADATIKRVALEPVIYQLALKPKKPYPSNYSTSYTKEKLDKVKKWGFNRNLGGHGWLVNEHGQYFSLQMQLCQAIKEAS